MQGVHVWGRRFPKRDAASTVAAFALVGCGGSSGEGVAIVVPVDPPVDPPVAERVVLGNRQLPSSETEVGRAYNVLEMNGKYGVSLLEDQIEGHLDAAYTTPDRGSDASVSYYVHGGTDSFSSATLTALYGAFDKDEFDLIWGVGTSWDSFSRAVKITATIKSRSWTRYSHT